MCMCVCTSDACLYNYVCADQCLALQAQNGMNKTEKDIRAAFQQNGSAIKLKQGEWWHSGTSSPLLLRAALYPGPCYLAWTWHSVFQAIKCKNPILLLIIFFIS